MGFASSGSVGEGQVLLENKICISMSGEGSLKHSKISWWASALILDLIKQRELTPVYGFPK